MLMGCDLFSPCRICLLEPFPGVCSSSSATKTHSREQTLILNILYTDEVKVKNIMTQKLLFPPLRLHLSVQTLTVTVWLLVSSVTVSMSIMTVSMSSVSSMTMSVCMFVLVAVSAVTVAVIHTAVKQRMAVAVT